jgi:hypothetical protein
VKQIQADLANGDTSDACGTLTALANQVRAQTGKSLTAAQAALLTADALKVNALLRHDYGGLALVEKTRSSEVFLRPQLVFVTLAA